MFVLYFKVFSPLNGGWNGGTFSIVITSTVESQVNKDTYNFGCCGGKNINNCSSSFAFYFLFTQKCETKALYETDSTFIL